MDTTRPRDGLPIRSHLGVDAIGIGGFMGGSACNCEYRHCMALLCLRRQTDVFLDPIEQKLLRNLR